LSIYDSDGESFITTHYGLSLGKCLFIYQNLGEQNMYFKSNALVHTI